MILSGIITNSLNLRKHKQKRKKSKNASEGKEHKRAISTIAIGQCLSSQILDKRVPNFEPDPTFLCFYILKTMRRGKLQLVVKLMQDDFRKRSSAQVIYHHYVLFIREAVSA